MRNWGKWDGVLENRVETCGKGKSVEKGADVGYRRNMKNRGKCTIL